MSSIDWSAVPRAYAIRQLGGRVPWFNGGWPVRSIAIEPRGRFFVVAGGRGLRLFHAATGELIRRLAPRVLSVSPERVGFSADGGTVFARVGGFHEPKVLCAWEVESGAVLRELGAPAEPEKKKRKLKKKPKDVAGVEAVHGDPMRAITTNNHSATVWDLDSGAIVRSIDEERGGFGVAAFLGTAGARAVVARGAEDVFFWDLASGSRAVGATIRIGVTRSLAAPADGRWFAVGDDRGRARIHDPGTAELLFTLGEATPTPYGNDVSGLAVSADGQRLAAMSAMRVKVWDVETRAQLLDEKLPSVFYQAAIGIDPRGAWVVCAARDGTMRRFDLDGSPGAPVSGRPAHRASVSSVAFGPDGSVFSADATLKLRWDDAGLAHVVDPEDAPRQLGAWSTEATIVGSPSPPWLAKLEGLIEVQRQLEGGASAPVVGATLAANIVESGEVLIWDLAISESPLQRLVPGVSPHEPVPARTIELALHPDGRRIAIATNRHDAPLQLWDAREGRPLLVCEGHEASVNAVAFSADGSLLVSGSDDRTVRVWPVL